jgi:hypothetical protein
MNEREYPKIHVIESSSGKTVFSIMCEEKPIQIPTLSHVLKAVDTLKFPHEVELVWAEFYKRRKHYPLIEVRFAREHMFLKREALLDEELRRHKMGIFLNDDDD